MDTAMIAKMALPKSSGVISASSKRATVLGHLAAITLPQFSGVIDGSLLTAASSAFAALSLLTLLMNSSILSRRSVVSVMAPAALIWSGGVSARRAGAPAKMDRDRARAPTIAAIRRREMKGMAFLPDEAFFISARVECRIQGSIKNRGAGPAVPL
jgi:hypothetical protein